MSSKTAVGFAGLQSLVSDVAPAISAAKQRVARRVEAKAGVPATPPDEKLTGVRATATVAPSRTSQLPRKNVRWVKLGVMVAAAWLIIVWIGVLQHKSAASSYQAPSFNGAEVSAFSPTPAVLSEMPPERGDRDRVLGEAEIRFCLSEEIRMDAAKTVSTWYSEAQIDQYNTQIDDFNARCGNYRYRSADMVRAREDVERRRSDLEAEGRSRF